MFIEIVENNKAHSRRTLNSSIAARSDGYDIRFAQLFLKTLKHGYDVVVVDVEVRLPYSQL